MERAQAIWDPNLGRKFLQAMEKKNFEDLKSASDYLEYLLSGVTFSCSRPAENIFCEGDPSAPTFCSLAGCVPNAAPSITKERQWRRF